jgi:hypothetical protein
VFPLALLVEAPIIMLLAASTALSRDWDSYLRLRRFMRWSAVILTILHVTVAATPIYDLIVVNLMNAPEPIREPGRIGLLIMTPWTASIAYRRFNQGIFIRFNRSRLVGVGTVIRLFANLLVLGIAYAVGSWPGIVVATCAVTLGVVAEAIFVGLRVQPIIREELRNLPLQGDPLTLMRLLRFYVPLALTALINLAALPLYSAGLGRMPLTMESLATWPVISGLIFAFRSVGLSFNEVVVALIDRTGSTRNLFRFTLGLSAAVSALLFLLTATPLAWGWFSGVSGLEDSLARMGTRALWLALLLPGLGVLESWFTGILVQSHRTRAIPEAVLVSLGTVVLVLAVGVTTSRFAGLYVGIAAHALGNLLRVIWLWSRSRGEVSRLRVRDRIGDEPPAAEPIA